MNNNITEVLTSTSWQGKQCFLLGGGPSLENFDYNLIKDELTIGVNQSFIEFPATINYAMDYSLYEHMSKPFLEIPEFLELYHYWKRYKGIKVFLKRRRLVYNLPTYVVNNLSGQSNQVSKDLSKGISSGNNSGLGAILLACALGCKQIGLLGYDLKVDEKRRKTHWHNGYSNRPYSSFQPKLDKFIKGFNEFAPLLKDAGVEVTNLNPDSALQCFPFGEIRIEQQTHFEFPLFDLQNLPG